MSDEAVWKRRFLLFTLVRLSTLLLVLLGLAIAVGDLVRPGGWPLGGAVLIALAMVAMILVPKLLRKSWEQG